MPDVIARHCEPREVELSERARGVQARERGRHPLVIVGALDALRERLVLERATDRGTAERERPSAEHGARIATSAPQHEADDGWHHDDERDEDGRSGARRGRADPRDVGTRDQGRRDQGERDAVALGDCGAEQILRTRSATDSTVGNATTTAALRRAFAGRTALATRLGRHSVHTSHGERGRLPAHFFLGFDGALRHPALRPWPLAPSRSCSGPSSPFRPPVAEQGSGATLASTPPRAKRNPRSRAQKSSMSRWRT